MTSDAHAVRSADDPLANRGDIGIGYWQARKALADTFPIHPRLWEYPVTELREALSACADAFAAFVQHQHTAVCQGIKAIESQRDDARAALATAEAERDRLREALNPARLRNTANFLRNLADRRLRWWESAQAETRREADYLDTIADAATRRAPSTGGTP